jgi:hypothetical protein
MRDLLGEYGTLGKREVRDKLGDSNAVFKPSTSAAYIHYYELQPVNGEPRYAKITCKTNYGTIYDAYVCSPDDTIYDNSLYERG